MADRDVAEAHYRAFLSYSHKDGAAAARLHRRLEAYRIPKRLVGRDTARGPVPRRLMPIFRDREELPAATDLSETVREALAHSGALIILCSPAAAASLWVAEEIRVFRELHPGRPILAVILDGDPSNCFPPVLRETGEGHEPLATDLRRDGDGERLGLLKLVAGIAGLGLDDLVQRDAARRVRHVMAVTAAAVLAMLAMAALTWMAITARREAEQERAKADGLVDFMLTDLRRQLEGVGSTDVMESVNRRALAYYSAQRDLGTHSLLLRARILLATGDIRQRRNRYDEAASAFREAHQITGELLLSDPANPDLVFAHAQSEFWVGTIDYYRRDPAAARRAWLNYKALADRLLALEPHNPRSLMESAYAEGTLCTAARDLHDDARSTLALCQVSLARMQQVYAREPGDLERAIDVANRHAYVADAWRELGRRDQERAERDRQVALARLAIARSPDNANYQDFWMTTQFTYGDMLLAAGRRGEARTWMMGAAATARRLNERDPENANWQRRRREIEARLASLGGA